MSDRAPLDVGMSDELQDALVREATPRDTSEERAGLFFVKTHGGAAGKGVHVGSWDEIIDSARRWVEHGPVTIEAVSNHAEDVKPDGRAGRCLACGQRWPCATAGRSGHLSHAPAASGGTQRQGATTAVSHAPETASSGSIGPESP